MHISEGILGVPVLAAGTGLAILGTAIGLKKMDYERLPQVAVLSSAFFVASFIHVPLGPAAVHLVLNGLCGLLLGWLAFPAILVGLALQALLFQFGGLTTLGVNTFNLAFPGGTRRLYVRQRHKKPQSRGERSGRIHSGSRCYTFVRAAGRFFPRGYWRIVQCSRKAHRRSPCAGYGDRRHTNSVCCGVRETSQTGDVGRHFPTVTCGAREDLPEASFP